LETDRNTDQQIWHRQHEQQSSNRNERKGGNWRRRTIWMVRAWYQCDSEGAPKGFGQGNAC